MSLREKKQDSVKAIHAFTRLMSRKLRSTRAVTGCNVSMMPLDTSAHAIPHASSASTKIEVCAYQTQQDLKHASPDTINLLVLDQSSHAHDRSDHNVADAAVYHKGEHKSFTILLHRVLRHIASFNQTMQHTFRVTRWGAMQKTMHFSAVKSYLTSDLSLKKPIAKLIHSALENIVTMHDQVNVDVTISSDGALFEASLTLSGVDHSKFLKQIKTFKGLAVVAISRDKTLCVHIALPLHFDDATSLLVNESFFALIKQDSIQNKLRRRALKEAS